MWDVAHVISSHLSIKQFVLWHIVLMLQRLWFVVVDVVVEVYTEA